MKLIFDALEVKTRERTEEGFLRAGAVITKTGIVDYTTEELGKPGPVRRVRVKRARENVFHKDTLRTLRGAPLTIGHPKDEGGNVSPKTWRQKVVGNIVGEPQESMGETLMADVLVGDEEAIKTLEDGTGELSIGFGCKVREAALSTDCDFEIDGPLDINHVAIVKQGRAGSSVRVLDQKGDEMEAKEILEKVEEITSAAVVKALGKNQEAGVDPQAISKAITDAMSPALKRMDEVADKEKRRLEDEEKEKAEISAKEAAEKLVAQTKEAERSRYGILKDARLVLGDEKIKPVEDKDAKEILVLAVGDAVPEADKQPEEFLRGVLTGMVKSGKTSGQRTADPAYARVGDAGNDAMKEFIETTRKAYMAKGSATAGEK